VVSAISTWLFRAQPPEKERAFQIAPCDRETLSLLGLIIDSAQAWSGNVKERVMRGMRVRGMRIGVWCGTVRGFIDTRDRA
jgi:hypothetical protein